MSKSSHYEDYDVVLTFGWFCDRFLLMSMQKLAILIGWISTISIYIVGIFDLAKTARDHNTQNTQQPTWAIAAPYPSAALPSIAMETTAMETSAMAPTLGAASPHKSIQGSHQRVWQCHGQCLRFRRQRIPHQKIELWVYPWPQVAADQSRYLMLSLQQLRHHQWFVALVGCGASLGGSQSDASKIYIRWVRLTSHESDETTHKNHKQPCKHHHHHLNGDGAAPPSSGVDLMMPCHWRGGQPWAYFFQGHHCMVLIDSLN